MAPNPPTGARHRLGLPMEFPISTGGLKWISSLWMRPSVQSTCFVFAGKLASAGAGFFSTILIARYLGQRDFGLFSFAATVMVLGYWLTGGVVELGLIRSFSAHAENAPRKADAVLRVALTTKVALGVGLAVLGWFLAEPMAVALFGKPEFIHPVRYGVAGALGLSLWGFVLATLQARQAFRGYVLGEVGSALFRLGLVGFLLLTAQLSLTAALLVYVLVSFVSFAIGMAFTPSGTPPTKAARREAWRELLVLGKWLMVSWVFASLHMRLDMLMLGYFGAVESLGQYAVASSLVSPLDLLSTAVFTVLLPKASRMTRRQDFLNVLKMILIGGGALAAALLVVWALAEPLVVTVYTIKYVEAVPVFRLLLFGPVFGLVGLSATAVLLALDKPQVLAALDGILLIAVFAGNTLLVPDYGIHGAAIVVLASRVVSGLGLWVCAFRESGRFTGGHAYPPRSPDRVDLAGT